MGHLHFSQSNWGLCGAIAQHTVWPVGPFRISLCWPNCCFPFVDNMCQGVLGNSQQPVAMKPSSHFFHSPGTLSFVWLPQFCGLCLQPICLAAVHCVLNYVKKVYFSSWFWRTQSPMGWPWHFGPVMRHTSCGTCGGVRLLILWQLGSDRERKRERETALSPRTL